jgi:hypothetical protein
VDDWPRVLETANRGWVGPALFVALRDCGRLLDVPEDERNYLGLLHDRNRARNLRLRAQLFEATAALNAVGVRPILLKGAIRLFGPADAKIGARMISDLDLSFRPSEVDTARAALASIGYTNVGGSNEMGRPQDAGTIELHTKANARSATYLRGELRNSSHLVEQDGHEALVPDSTSQALHLMVHDMIKEGDYWRFRIDLRHLLDLAELARSPEGLNWGELRAAMHGPTGQRALQLQATALREIFLVDTPADLRSARSVSKHFTSVAAANGGSVATLIKAVGGLFWGLHRISEGIEWRGVADFFVRSRRAIAAPTKGSRI